MASALLTAESDVMVRVDKSGTCLQAIHEGLPSGQGPQWSLRGRRGGDMQVHTRESTAREQDIAIIESYVAEAQYELADAIRKTEEHLASAVRLLKTMKSQQD
jgi:hypothetical protein